MRFVITECERVEGKRGKKGLNGEEKYEKVQKRSLLDTFILHNEKTIYQIIGSWGSIFRSSVDFFNLQSIYLWSLLLHSILWLGLLGDIEESWQKKESFFKLCAHYPSVLWILKERVRPTTHSGKQHWETNLRLINANRKISGKFGTGIVVQLQFCS